MKSIAIVGGTGQTGKWALKGALLRGYKVVITFIIYESCSILKYLPIPSHQVKLLARNPDKVTKILETLFEEGEVSKHQENVTVVKGGAKDEEALVELLTGLDTVLSCLGMVEPPTWIVAPGVEAIIKALKKVAESKSLSAFECNITM